MVGISAHDHRFPLEIRIKQFLDGNKKCIHVHMENNRVHCLAGWDDGRLCNCALLLAEQTV